MGLTISRIVSTASFADGKVRELIESVFTQGCQPSDVIRFNKIGEDPEGKWLCAGLCGDQLIKEALRAGPSANPLALMAAF